ncbi:MAG: hypothetical protein KJP09_12060 [Bacteroidia bacterium]|nr:hypothetical protein [Bacteroidia bacterium]MBT8310876.1 hypothetical protein [Bacteroidia bacterium]NND10877.1 hypothetical protein [Flavobacteriaceae bacterium]NNK27153.1 hypothetical protein [Flavobacteriaceae bacterium]
MAMIITPSIVTLLDLDYDISIMVDANEEEEKEGKESANDKELKIIQVIKKGLNTSRSSFSAMTVFYSNSYSSNFQDLISPPPEFNI